MKDLGGDRAAYDAVNNDLKALRHLNRVVSHFLKRRKEVENIDELNFAFSFSFFVQTIPGVHTLLTAVIDYKGHRLVAQNIIPGT